MPDPFWTKVDEAELRQGDFLPQCLVPVFNPDYGRPEDVTHTVPVSEYDLIVVTQSCDLENQKAPLVAMSPIYTLSDFEKINEKFKKPGAWETVRKGRVEGLHLLASPETPVDNSRALVVSFREVYSLPIDYLMQHASAMGPRWRLESPYLEHFSQSFARFFMRVGLPSSIPPFS